MLFKGEIRYVWFLAFWFELINSLDSGNRLVTIHYWHKDVHNYDVEVVPRIQSYNFYCLHSVLRNLYIEEFLKLILVPSNDLGIVIDKKHIGPKQSRLILAIFISIRLGGIWVRHDLVFEVSTVVVTIAGIDQILI